MRKLLSLGAAAAGLAVVTIQPAEAQSSGVEKQMEESCLKEVVELHQFLESWFNATIPNSDESYARFADVLAPKFELVGPEGKVDSQSQVVTGLRTAYGRWKTNPGRIRIDNARLLHAEGNLFLVSYEEWQESETGTVGRLSTVLLGVNNNLPNRLEWLHLHEVWIAE